MDVRYKADLSVWPVRLVKDTNRFRLLLSRVGDGELTRADAAPYTFAITTPEGAVYAADNSPKFRETVVYIPYYLAPGEGEDELAEGSVNTMRLFHGDSYTLTVRDTQTGLVEWDYDLMTLLANTKTASRPDGSTLPMQEYLDRRSEWEIVILYHTGPGDDGFVAVAVRVNGWIIWLNDIEL